MMGSVRSGLATLNGTCGAMGAAGHSGFCDHVLPVRQYGPTKRHSARCFHKRIQRSRFC